MNLVASLVVRDELARYLEPCVASLLGFCDAIIVLDDGSTDGTYEWLLEQPKVYMTRGEPGFFENEGRTRQKLLEITLAHGPSHVLAIDADEFVADGDLVRKTVEEGRASVFSLCMSEVWSATSTQIGIRKDGRWGPHRAPILWKAPTRADASWRIPEKEGAGGRIPKAVVAQARSAFSLDIDILHFGWANQRERLARHARYADRGGFGHDPRHIASILLPDAKVTLDRQPWPPSLDRKSILAGVNGKTERRYTLKEIRAMGWREP